jgi:hypothetical protein
VLFIIAEIKSIAPSCKNGRLIWLAAQAKALFLLYALSCLLIVTMQKMSPVDEAGKKECERGQDKTKVGSLDGFVRPTKKSDERNKGRGKLGTSQRDSPEHCLIKKGVVAVRATGESFLSRSRPSLRWLTYLIIVS